MNQDRASETNSERPDWNPQHSQASSQKPSGCRRVMIVLGVIAGLFLVLIVCCYIALMHTAWPLQQIAQAIEDGGAQVHLKVRKVSGSVSSGIRIESITWDDGEIVDVRILYNGFFEVFRTGELIVREVHVGKAHLNVDVDGSNSISIPKQFKLNSAGDGKDQPGGNAPDDGSLKLFQIDRVSLNDIILKNKKTGFQMTIPSIQWIGFKARPGNVEFGELTADTDQFKLTTRPGTSPEFQKRVDGTLLPKLHPSLRRPINFGIDIGSDKSNVMCRWNVFEDNLQFDVEQDGTIRIHCRELNLTDYFDTPLPENLTIEADSPEVADAKLRQLNVSSGSFKLGLRSFVIQPTTLGAKAPDDHSGTLVAISQEGEFEIEYTLESGDGHLETEQIKQRLTANPPLDAKDILAQVFVGKNFADLDQVQQEEIDKKITWFVFR